MTLSIRLKSSFTLNKQNAKLSASLMVFKESFFFFLTKILRNQ